MKRVGAMVLIVLATLMWVRPLTAFGAEEPLTAAEVEAALAYGQKSVERSNEEFFREWLVFAPDGAGAVIIKTPFLAVAYLARQAFKKNGQPPSRDDLDGLLFQLRALRETVNVEVILFQKAEEVDADYRFRLTDAKVEQPPISLERKTFELEPPSGDEVRFETRVDLFFQRPGPAPSPHLRIVVIAAGRPMLSLPLDLSKVR